MNKMESWFNRFCANKHALKSVGNNPDYKDLACVAANLSYRASVLRALNFNGKNSEGKLARLDGEKIVIDFLYKIFESQNVASLDYVSDVWSKIYDTYKKHNIEDYTYGNAQKWVNMSIKYYIILLKHFKIECENLTQIPVFPVDRIMINHIKKDLDISFDGSWSNCNDIVALKDYICKVKSKVGSTLFEYELDAWN